MTLEELAPRVAASLHPFIGKRLMAAVSGGADSVALLLILTSLRETSGLTVEAAHVEHGLRGEESRGDADFVRALCARLNVPLTVTELSPPPNAGETWAREARYAALMNAARRQGCEALVLAHHRDDQAETVLEHLLRGCGTEGLAGMRPVTSRDGMTLLRPLLTVSREELRQALRLRGEVWREDSSNARADCLRNRLRLTLLPAMEALVSHAGEHVAALAELAEEEQRMLEEHAVSFLQKWGATQGTLPVDALLAEHPVMRKRILRLWWGKERPMLDRAHTEALAALVEASVGSRCMLPCGLCGERGYRYLHLTGEKPPAVAPAPLPMDGAVTSAGITVTVAPASFGDAVGDGKHTQLLPKSALAGCVVRCRQTGDRFRPFGAAGHRKLQDELVDRRVDAAFRDRVPLIARGQDVLLIAGVGASEKARLTRGEEVLRVSFSGKMPWMDQTED